jgi:mono/diheme cytochrome c family protein
MRRLLILPLLLAGAAHAQDGGQLFTLYCSACHGVDGMGATGGQFPPLAGSPWIQGDPARPVKIALLGLHGQVDVEGRVYDLEMPPQGGVLADDQLAAILTYVRSSWGNHEAAIDAAFVKSTRAGLTRTTAWTSAELLKENPLPVQPPPIANLTSRVYHGQWRDLPDFSQLQPVNMEEEQSGLLSMKQSDIPDYFGLVWEGDLTAPGDGPYIFHLDADDGARVLIDGKSIAEVRGLGPLNGSRAKEGKADLTAGVHKLRVEFYEYTDNQGIQLAWKGPGIPFWRNLSDTPVPPPKEKILIAPVAGRAVIYRNFIEGVSPRAIGVGFPGGVNLAYSADHLAPERLWTGDFIDATRHWTDRGQGNEPPAGDHVVKLSNSPALPQGTFRGYKLDPAGNPTFSVQIGNRILLDSWKPGARSFTRTLSLSGSGEDVDLLLTDQLEVKPGQLGDLLNLAVEHATLQTKGSSTYIHLTSGQPATLTYQWR